MVDIAWSCWFSWSNGTQRPNHLKKKDWLSYRTGHAALHHPLPHPMGPLRPLLQQWHLRFAEKTPPETNPRPIWRTSFSVDLEVNTLYANLVISGFKISFRVDMNLWSSAKYVCWYIVYNLIQCTVYILKMGQSKFFKTSCSIRRFVVKSGKLNQLTNLQLTSQRIPGASMEVSLGSQLYSSSSPGTILRDGSDLRSSERVNPSVCQRPKWHKCMFTYVCRVLQISLYYSPTLYTTFI